MSSDKELVKEIDGKIYKNAEWYLVIDSYSFHVYVAVIIPNKNLQIRIDWQDNSQLTFEKYKFNKNEKSFFIFKQDFCKLCLENEIKNKLTTYKLFTFNCRSVSFIILCLAGYDPKKLFVIFETNNVLCGIQTDQCITFEELIHYLDWDRGNHGECILF